MDLLGACDSADCSLSVLHGASDQPFVAALHFELRDASAVESPPPFDRQLPPRARLRLLFRYLRNNVRWCNFFRPMRELWDLQDELENRWEGRPSTGERRDVSRHHELHQEVMEAVRERIRNGSLLGPGPRSPSFLLEHPNLHRRQAYEQVEVSAQPPLWRESFSRRVNPVGGAARLGLHCDLQLSGARKALLPLDLEFLDEQRVRRATRHPSLSPQSSYELPTPALAPAPAPSPVFAVHSSLLTLMPLLKLPESPLSPAGRDLAVDWGPWFRVRVHNTPYGFSADMLPARLFASERAVPRPRGPWDDCGEELRAGGEYGFRGEVRVTFPPRALSSIVAETLIAVRDTASGASLSSERRFV